MKVVDIYIYIFISTQTTRKKDWVGVCPRSAVCIASS